MAVAATINLEADTKEIDKAIDELYSYFKSVRGLLKLFKSRFNPPDELIDIKPGTAMRAGVFTVFLKPSKIFLKLLAAGRTGNIKNFIVKGTHK